MHDDDYAEDAAVRAVPRWVEIPLGLLLGAVTLLCGLGALALVIAPSDKAPLLAPAVGIGMLWMTGWLLDKCLRLVSGRPNQGGLLSPRALRAIGYVFLLLPLSLFAPGNHYLAQHGLRAVLQVMVFLMLFFALRRMAAAREAANAAEEAARALARPPARR